MRGAVRVGLLAAVLMLTGSSVDAGRATAIGIASWYGWREHGRTMANGQLFNALALSAASVTVPLGSWVVVTRLDDGRTVTLQITDRGPYVRGRIIDLSLAAARVLGMVEVGLLRVRVERIKNRPEGFPPRRSDTVIVD
jgi:rare lipoprotein A